jgi:hypothetical protein
MKKGLTVILILWSLKISFACGCGGPLDSLKNDIKNNENIFIGVIESINKEHKFHLSHGNGYGYKYINFNILKIYKGVNEAQLKISVFDNRSNTSCEGLIGHKSTGDTILVFANEFNQWMIGSNLCGRHPRFSELNENEKIFIDTAKWIDPKLNHVDAAQFINQNFPIKKEDCVSQNTNKGKWMYLVIASIIFLIIGIAIGKKLK